MLKFGSLAEYRPTKTVNSINLIMFIKLDKIWGYRLLHCVNCILH